MTCWEPIHVDVIVTCITYLNIVADQVHTLMVTIFPNISGFFRQDNAASHTANIVFSGFNVITD